MGGIAVPRSCGLLCALLSEPDHDLIIVEYHFTSLPGAGENDFFSGFWKEKHSFSVVSKCDVVWKTG